MIHVALKWTKILSMFTAMLLLIAVCLVGGLLLTNTGLDLALYGTQQFVPQLKIGKTEGALFPDFTLHDVRYADDKLGIDFQAKTVQLGIKVDCFMDAALCIKQLNTQGLTLKVTDTQPATTPPPNNDGPLNIATPIPVYIGGLKADNTDLDIMGTRLQWQHLALRAFMSGNSLHLDQSEWKGIRLRLPKSEKPSSPPQANRKPIKPQDIRLALERITLPLNVYVKQLDVYDFQWLTDAPLVVNHLGLSGKAVNDRVTIHALSLKTPQGHAQLNGDAQLSGNYPLNIALKGKTQGQPLDGQGFDIKASGSLAHLNVVANLQGPLTGDINGKVALMSAAMPFDLRLKDVKGNWPLQGAADYHVHSSNLTARGDLTDYQFTLRGGVTGATIPATKLTMSGAGDLYQVKVTRLLMDTLKGQLSGAVSAHWKQAVNWQGQFEFKDIHPGEQWPDVPGVINGQLQTSGQLTEQGGWKVTIPTLELDGELRQSPLNVQGQLAASDTQGNGDVTIDTEGLSLSHGNNHADITGSLSDHWDMTVALNIPDLHESLPQAQGSVVGKLQLKGAMKQPKIQLNLQGKAIEWQQLAALDRIQLSGSVAPLVDPTVDLTLKASGLTYQQQHVSSLTLAVSGTEKHHRITFDTVADKPQIQTHLALSGSLKDRQALLWKGKISRWTIQAHKSIWRLSDALPITINGDKPSLSLAAHCWRQGEASICLNKDTTIGKQGSVDVAINHVNFADLDDFLPKGTRLQGEAQAQLKAKWGTEQTPQVNADIELTSGQVVQQLNHPMTLGWNKVDVKATLADNQLKAHWLIDVTDNGKLSGDVTIPDVTQTDKTMQGHLKLTPFNLDFLANQFGQYSRVASSIETDLSFSGDVLHPKVTGKLSVNDIEVHGDISPVEVDDGQFGVDFNGYTAQLNANVSTKEGQLLVDGEADWHDMANWFVNAHVGAKGSLKVTVPPMFSADIIPDLKLALHPDEAKITGQVHLPSGHVKVEKLPPSAVNVSKDQVLLNKEMQPIDPQQGLPFKVETSILVDIGKDFDLDAFGLKAGLNGRLKVTQNDKGPFVSGEVNLTDGTYRSFGQDLLIKEGKVMLNGPIDKPYLSITAIRNPENTEDDVTAGIKVTGSVDMPKVTIFSEPAMPQANALSYLLRGQNIDGQDGGDPMTATLIGLSLAQSGKLVGEIGNAVGVRDLQLDTKGSGDESQVTVSGYILPGLQVKYGVGIFNSVGEFTIRYRLMKDLYIEAVSGLSSAVDVLYQFEFD
ncbi:translocation/assembly module TamB domain-containing protein [Vibrio zhugei]|uniref:Translocation/assembly module TamB domain-containing protein n=1 Tax=Vibrio zhugei TaxID=2479546 RepID=A0ABV7C7F5_9VIBR|nr:translocation/assembly module TamB domain-containing protein [Vibrio zhugei]